MRDRASYAFATVSVAAIIDVAGGTVRSARMAFGGLAHQPWRVQGAEVALAGATLNQASANAAADRVLQGARGFGHNDFKIPLLRSTLRAVLTEA